MVWIREVSLLDNRAHSILNTKYQIFSYKTFNYLYHMDTFVLVILCVNVIGTDVTRLKVVL